jgi:hypothetical protein
MRLGGIPEAPQLGQRLPSLSIYLTIEEARPHCAQPLSNAPDHAPLPERTSAVVLSQRTRIRGQPRLSCRHEEAEGEVLQPRWGVYRLGGKRAERMLFTVTARDAEQAIEENQIPERERWRISVQREA